MLNKKYKIILLIVFFLVLSCKKEAIDQQNKIAEYQINFIIQGDSFSKNITQSYRTTKSVFEIMLDLKKQNQLDFKFTGEGDNIFITEIHQIQNEGFGKEKKNWLYFINGELAQKGVSQTIIEKNTEILWCYTKWEDKEQCINKNQGEKNDKKY